jgi:hypothetical protein
MYLIQIFLPVYGNDGTALPHEQYEQTRNEIVQRFGGLTTYSRAPASGLWQERNGNTIHDDLLVYEVMADEVDEEWWRGYRRILERRFMQDAIVVRAQPIQLL